MASYITTQLTGHMYRNSPIESDDSCGNCNGARCHACERIYQVGGETFSNIEDAKAYAAELNSLFQGHSVEVGMLCMIRGKLHLQVYDRECPKGQRFIEGKEGELYEKYKKIWEERMREWRECGMPDKHDECSGNPCKDYGCHTWANNRRCLW